MNMKVQKVEAKIGYVIDPSIERKNSCTYVYV